MSFSTHPNFWFAKTFLCYEHNHALVVGLESDAHEGKFVENEGNLEVSLKRGITKSKKLPEVNVAWEGSHHKTTLSIDSKRKTVSWN